MNVDAVTRSRWSAGVRKVFARLMPARKAGMQIPEPVRGDRLMPGRVGEPQSDFWNGFERRPGSPSRDGEQNQFGEIPRLNILVPIDFTGASLSALDCAFRMARDEKARVTLLHAIHLNLSPRGPANVDLIKREMLRSATAKMSRMTNLAHQDGIRADYLIQEGRPSAVIGNVLKTGGVDLLVMARRPHHGLGRWLRRRTAQKVVRAAQCPVVVLQAEADKLERAL